MSQAINFYGIEEAGESAQARLPRAGWTSAGRELDRRPARLTFASEYHRLLAKEQREPWAALLVMLAVLLCAAGIVYGVR